MYLSGICFEVKSKPAQFHHPRHMISKIKLGIEALRFIEASFEIIIRY
jgi:hypothetical protein